MPDKAVSYLNFKNGAAGQSGQIETQRLDNTVWLDKVVSYLNFKNGTAGQSGQSRNTKAG